MTTILKDEELPERLKEQQRIAHEIAKQTMPQIWDMSTESLYKIKNQITGNDALAYFGTIISDFSALWMFEMNRLAQSDDAGITTEDLVKDTINGILAKINCRADFDDEPQLPNGIKRLGSKNEQ